MNAQIAGLIDPANRAGEIHHSFLIQPERHCHSLGVVCNSDVLIAHLARAFRHFLQ